MHTNRHRDAVDWICETKKIDQFAAIEFGNQAIKAELIESVTVGREARDCVFRLISPIEHVVIAWLGARHASASAWCRGVYLRSVGNCACRRRSKKRCDEVKRCVHRIIVVLKYCCRPKTFSSYTKCGNFVPVFYQLYFVSLSLLTKSQSPSVSLRSYMCMFVHS